MDVETVLKNCPLIALEEAAVCMDVDVTTARRRFAAARDQGLATYHVVGRQGHNEQRWVPTDLGIQSLYPDPEDIPWWLTESGIGTMLGRVEQLRAIYRLAPGLFLGVGRGWHQEAEPPRLVELVFLREGGLVTAVGRYAGDISIHFCWVGKELKQALMMRKWEGRFEHLGTYSLAEHMERRRDQLIDPPDPDYDPTPRPSGYVIIGGDQLAFYMSYRQIPGEATLEEQPFLFTHLDDGDVYVCEGVVQGAPYDQVWDVPEGKSRRPGRPQKLIRYDGEPHPEDLFGSVLPHMILNLVEDWWGLRVKDIARYCHQTRAVVNEAVQGMLMAEWLVEVGGMLYLGTRGCLYVARRDRVSPETVKRRIRDAIAQDHRAVGPHRRHTIAINEVMIRLHEDLIVAYPGWRAVMNLPGTQINPDMVFLAETLLGAGIYYIEVERTAVHPEQILDKVFPYREAHRLGIPARAIFITETPEAEDRFSDLSRGVPGLTSTLRDVKHGPLWGEETAWRFLGSPVALL